MFSQPFIVRSFFFTIVSLFAVLASAASIYAVSPAEDLKPKSPAVHVTASYPGADPKVVQEAVAAPIEQQMKGVEDLLSMSSTCSSDGRYSLTVVFKSGTDHDQARILVRNRVALAEPQLPEAVRRRGVTVK